MAAKRWPVTVVSTLMIALVPVLPGFASISSNRATSGGFLSGLTWQPLTLEVAGDGRSPARHTDSIVAVRGRFLWPDDVESKRIERIRSARKRRPGDRVYVALEVMGDKHEQTPWLKEAVGLVRAQLTADSAVRLVGKADLAKAAAIRSANVAAGLSPNRAPVADVKITIQVHTRKFTGRGKNMIEPNAIVAFEATLVSNFSPEEYTVREAGPSSQDGETARRFAANIGRLIREIVVPTLPVDRNL